MGTYVVTGAASGIGKATKQSLEADGHQATGGSAQLPAPRAVTHSPIPIANR